MNIAEYETVEAELLALAKSVRDRKRPSYTVGDDDVLMNFKRDAKMSGITPLQNWHTHFQKQVAAIARWVQAPDAEQSEPIEQRFADIINYCLLGYAAMRERCRSDLLDVLRETGTLENTFRGGIINAGGDYATLADIAAGKYDDSDFHPV